MVTFIDDHRQMYGVEPICRVLPIAPSTYYPWKAWEANPQRRSRRAQEDERLRPHVHRVWTEHRSLYRAEKVWKEMGHQGIRAARCTVERLMKSMGPQGVVRGKRTFTTIPGDPADRPMDLVNRDFRAERPNQLWVSELQRPSIALDSPAMGRLVTLPVWTSSGSPTYHPAGAFLHGRVATTP